MFRNLKVTIYGVILPNSRIVSYYLHLKESWQLLTDESAFAGSSREAPAHHQRGKKSNLRLGKFQHVRETIVLYLCHPSAPDFLEEKWVSAMWDTVNGPTSFSPHLEHGDVLYDWEVGEAGRTAPRALGGHQKVADPTKCFVDSIRKLAHELPRLNLEKLEKMNILIMRKEIESIIENFQIK